LWRQRKFIVVAIFWNSESASHILACPNKKATGSIVLVAEDFTARLHGGTQDITEFFKWLKVVQNHSSYHEVKLSRFVNRHRVMNDSGNLKIIELGKFIQLCDGHI